MKIVIISDTHLNEVKLPPGDVLVHCGDGLSGGTLQELVKLNAWLGKVKHQYRYVLYSPGNHDKIFEHDLLLARSIMTNATVLVDQAFDIDGFRFYCSPWTPEFCFWSYQILSLIHI